MWSKECKFEATLFMTADGAPEDWVPRLLAAMPPEFRPEYFSRTDRLRRRPELAVENVEAFRAYLRGEHGFYFFGPGYELSIAPPFRGLFELQVYSKSVRSGAQLMLSWVPRLERSLFYAWAGASDECEHRNFFKIRTVETGGCAQGWMGRDHRRYVPGLYWLNYFSRAFMAQHNLAVGQFAELPGKATESEHGLLLQLYDSPASWEEWTARVDDYLFARPNFFSRRRVPLQEQVPVAELTNYVSQVLKPWP